MPVESCLERIRSPEGRELNAYISVVDAPAPAAAGELHGVALCVKDVIDVAGFPTTSGVKARQRIPERDAAVVAVLRAAGATVIGKGHTNQLAYGIDGANPDFGPALNPHDHGRVTGGSSSGPAVAVAAGLADLALGTDTSGSLRVPAAFCGVAALRPTHGRLALDGVQPLNPSFDTVGPMAATVGDLATAWSVLSGEPEAPQPPERVTLLEDLVEGCHPEVVAAVERVCRALGDQGVDLVRGRTGRFERSTRLHPAIQFSEASASLQPLLGAGYPGVAEEMRERLLAGERTTAIEYLDAQRERGQITRELLELLDGGLALAPSVPMPAPRVGEANRLELLSRTILFSQAGVPVLALPAGDAGGCPTGVQVAGPPGSEGRLLALGRLVERQL
jgi:Asp-tRNA(Asn)/Glu-tRNA(Gln) amidotransferase A subunit family amidase